MNAQVTTATRHGLSQKGPGAACFKRTSYHYRVRVGLASSVHEVFGLLIIPRAVRNPQDIMLMDKILHYPL